MTTPEEQEYIKRIAKFYGFSFYDGIDGELVVDSSNPHNAQDVWLYWNDKYNDFDEFLVELKNYFKNL